MTVTFSMSMLQPIVALVAGILILLIPRILNYMLPSISYSSVSRGCGLTFYPPFRISERVDSKRKGFGRRSRVAKG